MAMAIAVQTLRLHQALQEALVREQLLRAEAERQRAVAEAQLDQTRAVLDAMSAQSKKSQP
jgi:hypothetical protein